jgi:hypothetical protein
MSIDYQAELGREGMLEIAKRMKIQPQTPSVPLLGGDEGGGRTAPISIRCSMMVSL